MFIQSVDIIETERITVFVSTVQCVQHDEWHMNTQVQKTGFIRRFFGLEPEFLNILKCNSAESASAGFQFN
jgi:hypothetical protein